MAFFQGVIRYEKIECLFFFTIVYKEIWRIAQLLFIKIFAVYIYFHTAELMCWLFIEILQVYFNRTEKPKKFPFLPSKLINRFSSVWMNRYIFRITSLSAHFYLSHLLRVLCSVADVSGYDTWAWNLSVWYLWWNSFMKHPDFQLVVLCTRNLAEFWLSSRAVIKGWYLLFSEISE